MDQGTPAIVSFADDRLIFFSQVFPMKDGKIFYGTYDEIFTLLLNNIHAILKEKNCLTAEFSRITLLLSMECVPFNDYDSLKKAYEMALDFYITRRSKSDGRMKTPPFVCYWVSRLPYNAPIGMVVDALVNTPYISPRYE